MTTIGQRIIQLREERGMNRATLAKLAEVPTSSLQDIEDDNAKNIRIEYFQRITNVLIAPDATPVDFFKVVNEWQPQDEGVDVRLTTEQYQRLMQMLSGQ